MAESRLVPCNLLAWPRIRDLLPDQKLMVIALWAISPSSAGCWLLDVPSFAAQTSIQLTACLEGVKEFQRRGLLEFDEATGEIFVVDWFRFHKFPPGPRQRLLRNDVDKIQSERLKHIVLYKSASCVSREEKESKVKVIKFDSARPWFLSCAGISLKGVEAGIQPPGEDQPHAFPAFKQKVLEYFGVSEEEEKSARRRWASKNYP